MLMDKSKTVVQNNAMQCNLRAARARVRIHTLTHIHILRPRSFMQLAVPVIPGGRPRDPALPQGGRGRAHPRSRPAARETTPEQARRAIIIVAVAAAAAAAVVAVTPEVQRGAERATLAPRAGPAVLQAFPLDFVEQEVHLALHAEHVARAGLLDLLVADAPPAVLLLLLGRPGRVRGRRRGPV